MKSDTIKPAHSAGQTHTETHQAVYHTQIIWAQIDANGHLRHSAYADLAAQARIALLDSAGMVFSVFQKLQIGPILFREELLYLREVAMNDKVTVTTALTKARADGSRWSIRHELFRADGVKAAVINVDGAWMDLVQRRLIRLPQELATTFMSLPRAADFEQKGA